MVYGEIWLATDSVLSLWVMEIIDKVRYSELPKWFHPLDSGVGVFGLPRSRRSGQFYSDIGHRILDTQLRKAEY